MDKNSLKKTAAEEAVSYIKSGMVVGLGTGSTAFFAIQKIGQLVKDGELKDIVGLPTSKRTEELAVELGIPLSDLSKNPKIDITIDGADEVDDNLDVIKGGGGALLREKVIAQATKKQIIIVDDSKISKYLGENWSVPIEVLKFALESEKIFLQSIGGKPVLRNDEAGNPYVTDEGNYILDTNFGIIKEPKVLAANLSARAGIVEHGIFIDLVDEVIVAAEGGIKKIEKK